VIYTIGINSEFVEFIEIPVEEAIKLIEPHKLLCEDVETKTLDYRLKDPLKLVQIGTEKDQFIFTPEYAKYLKPILEDRSYIKIVVNGIFERSMLRSIGIQMNSMFDLALAYKVSRQGKSMRIIPTAGGNYNIYSLAGMYKELLDIDMKKEEQSSFLNGSDIYTKAQLEYAANDVKLYNLYYKILNRLIKLDLIDKEYKFDTVPALLSIHKFSKSILEFKFQEYIADMLYNGIHIDKNKWLALYTDNKNKSLELEKDINSIVIDGLEDYKLYRKTPFSRVAEKQQGLFGYTTVKDKKKVDKRRINWKSNIQVKTIFSKFEIKLPYKDGKQTINIKELEKIKGTNKLLAPYIKYKKLVKLVDSFGVKMFDNINEHTDRIHFSIDQLLATGRIAPKKPNMAQIPSGKEWRDCFTPQKDDYMMVGADYSAQESRIMAYKSKDSVFMDFFENGDGDSHSMIASRVFSKKEKLDVIVKKHKLTVKADKVRGIDYIKEAYPLALAYIMEEGNPTAVGKLTISREEYTAFGKEHYIKLYPNIVHIVDEPAKDFILFIGEPCPLRTKGKILNFFISFGGSAHTLSQSQGISMDEANALLVAFWEGFPELRAYFDKEKKLGIANGYNIINAVSKGKRFYPAHQDYKIGINKITRWIKEDGFESYKKKTYSKGTAEYINRVNTNRIKGDIERASMNTGIQGTAADMTKTSAILLMEALERKGYDLVSEIKPVNMIHDEHLLEVKSELADEVSKLLRNTMEKSSMIFIGTIIPAEPYKGNQWEH